jgi:riboflavin biosynthesis pyrimidine reductase
MRMLFPEPADPVDPEVVYADLPAAAGRPSVRLNMIVSVDGGTSWNGVSGALGGPADKALFAIMRSLTDVVLVASGTMRAENYGPVVMSPERQDERRARGQEPVPAIAVVSGNCQFDWSTPFFAAATRRPIIVTVDTADARARAEAERHADVIVAGADSVDLAFAITEIGARGARSILAEGGPTLNGELAQAMLLDELCVTLAPLLASGDAKRLIAGSPLEKLAPLAVRSVCEEDEYLFLRYRRAAASG